MTIPKLVEKLRGDQSHALNPPASGAEIKAVESRLGVKLPDDLKQFYSLANGGRLFVSGEEAIYGIFRVDCIKLVRVLVTGSDEEGAGPGDWYALVDLRDGNFIAAQFSQSGHAVHYIDIFHETFPDPETRIVATDFCSLLEGMSSKPELFWLR